MKALKVILVVILVLLVLVTGGFYLVTKKVPTPQNIVDEVRAAIDIYNGNVSTPDSDGKLFEFSAQKVKNAPEEELPASNTKRVYLCISDAYYFPVDVPEDVEIVTDYYKYIYAKDNSFYVTVLSGIDHDELSKGAGIAKATSLAPDIVRSEIGVKGPQEAVKHIVNDKAVVVRCYNNPVAFATVVESLGHSTYEVMEDKRVRVVEKEEDSDKPYTNILGRIPAFTEYHFSIDVGMVDLVQQFFVYDSGFVTIAREFKRWEDAVEHLSRRTAVCTGKSMIDAYYSSKDIVYYECGECTVGMVRVNYNTVITLFGTGDEARFNISYYLRTYDGEG